MNVTSEDLFDKARELSLNEDFSTQSREAYFVCVFSHPEILSTKNNIVELSLILGFTINYVFELEVTLGRLEILKLLFQGVYVQREPESILVDAFRIAAENGHLPVLQWLKEEVPNYLQMMIVSRSLFGHMFSPFRYAARNGHLSVLKWLQKEAPDLFQAMVSSASFLVTKFEAFHCAAGNGHLPVLRWLQNEAPNLFQEIITNNNYRTFWHAAQKGQLSVLQWYKEVVPDVLQVIIASGNLNEFVNISQKSHISVLQWLKDESLNHVEAIISFENFYLFRLMAPNGPLSVLKWLTKNVASDLHHRMIESDPQRLVFRRACQVHDFEFIDILLRNAKVFAYAMNNPHQYGNQTSIFISSKLQELHVLEQQLSAQSPDVVFDLTDRNELDLCYYMAMCSIFEDFDDSINNLDFLLSIPSVQAMAHSNRNELLRLALRLDNDEAVKILLAIPAVRELAEQNNFYAQEAHAELYFQELVNDPESSVNTLTTSEQKRLERLQSRYESVVSEKGVPALMQELMATLVSRYENNPAKVKSVNGVYISLPCDWTLFNAAIENLSDEKKVEAHQALYLHPDHTAYRYLSKPNPWMHPEAEFVSENETNPDEKWASFEMYQPLIALFYLAASDPTIPDSEGFTSQARLAFFINEVAFLGRAHNWDNSRYKEDGKSEEFDDLEGDRPSCFSGVKKRLFQSVLKHPDLEIFTKDILKKVLQDWAKSLFRKALEVLSIEHITEITKAYYNRYILLDDNIEYLKCLQVLDINEVEQKSKFIDFVNSKYPVQISDEPQFQKFIDTFFALVNGRITYDCYVQKWDADVGFNEMLTRAKNELEQRPAAPVLMSQINTNQSLESSTEEYSRFQNKKRKRS